MIRLDQTNRHGGHDPFFGDAGTDNYTVEIPPAERFSSIKVDILGENNGGARVAAEPSPDTTGTFTLRIRWFYSAGNFLTGFIHYRVRVITRHQDDSTTLLQGMEPLTARRKLVVLGDGFSAAQQADFNDAVRQLLIDGVFAQDLFRESLQALSVWRVNLVSAETPASERTYNDNGTPNNVSDDTLVSESLRNTALGCIFNGMWARSWFDTGEHQAIEVADALRRMVPDYDYVIIILNHPGFGGQGGGGFQTVSLGIDWTILAHEFGHGIGGLADEYSVTGVYTGGEPTSPNVTKATSRMGLKWGQFVDPTTPIPTGLGAGAGFTAGPPPAGWSDSDDAGLFEGGATRNTGISRPAINCRMNGNAPPYCPVCYTEIKRRLHPYTDHTFAYPIVGDFDGTGQHDLVLAMGGGLHRYRRNADQQFGLTLSAAGQLPGGWTLQPGDRYIVADFDGDGQDEILIYHYRSEPRTLGLLKSDGAGGLALIWSQDKRIGTWAMGYGDQLLPADWNGDGATDLYWIQPGGAVALMLSTPTGFRKIKSYTQALPGWWLDGSETFLAGDFDGQGRDDLFAYSGNAGHPPRAAVFRVQSNPRRTWLRRVAYDETRFAQWHLGSNDHWLAANVFGGQRTGLYVYNGVDWLRPMLATVWANTQSRHFTTDTVYEGSLPGWYFGRNDRFIVSGSRGGQPQGLIAYNADDWDTEMLGVIRNDGSNLSAVRTAELVDWTLGRNDRFLPCQLSPVAPGATDSVFSDMIVHTNDRLAVIDSQHLFVRDAHLRWIHHYRHGHNT